MEECQHLATDKMIALDAIEIATLDKQQRTNLINGLSGFKSALLLGTTNDNNQHNLALYSNVVHIGANPPLMGIIQRPVSVEKHTYENIKANGHFTINHIPIKLYKNGHQTSARYDRATSEFEACGFTPVFKGNIIAPFVGESPIQIGLTLEEEVKITSNDTLLLVGRIKEIYLAPGIIDEEGFIEIAKANTILVQGLESYYSANFVDRLPYAKPHNG